MAQWLEEAERQQEQGTPRFRTCLSHMLLINAAVAFRPVVADSTVGDYPGGLPQLEEVSLRPSSVR